MSEPILAKLQGIWKSIVTVPDVNDEEVPPEDDPVKELIDRNKGKAPPEAKEKGKEVATPVPAARSDIKPAPVKKEPPAVIILPPVAEKKDSESPKPEQSKEDKTVAPVTAPETAKITAPEATVKNGEKKTDDVLDIFTSEELKKGEVVISDGLEDVDVFALLREAQELAALLKSRKS